MAITQNYPSQVSSAASGAAGPQLEAPNEAFFGDLDAPMDETNKLRLAGDGVVLAVNKAGDRVVLPDGTTYSPPSINILEALQLEVIAPANDAVIADMFAAYEDRSERAYNVFAWDRRGWKGRTTVDLIHPSAGITNPRYIVVLGLISEEPITPAENVAPV